MILKGGGGGYACEQTFKPFLGDFYDKINTQGPEYFADFATYFTLAMLKDVTESLLEFLKLAPRYLVAVAIVCAILLFTPQELQQTLGTTKFVNDYRQWIGLALVSSLGVWLVAIVAWVGEWVRGLWLEKRWRKSVASRLENLTEPEKQILRYYFAKNTRGNKLRIENGDVQALTHAGIIFHSASLGSVLEGFAHNITDFAWEYILKNPHVLNGTTNTYYTDERERFW